MDELQKQMTEMRARWDGFTPRSRLFVMIGTAIAIAVAVLLLTNDPDAPDSVLYSNLSQEDAAQVVERLREMHVPYELASGGSAILIADHKVHDTRLTLAGEGLPSGGGVGFEIFDEQRFGESEFAEQVKYHRALEGELARTVSHLGGVEGARVHLVLPQRSLFTSTEQPASASVALRLRPGWQMRDDQVRGIVNLVASSVRGLTTERVTVVDGQGRRLSGGEGRQDELASDALSYRRQIEATKATAVQEMLDTTLGVGRSVVRVAADVSFTREERTEERFDPESVAARSFQLTEERDVSSSSAASGIPGTVSNLPGGEGPGASTTTTDGVVRRSETRNYEVSKVVSRAVEPVGRISRLNVAVMVDGIWTGEGAERTFEARPEQELTQLESIVASAVGADTERGDRVTVECVPFADPGTPPQAVEDLIDPLAPIGPYRLFLPYAAGLLGLLVLGALGLVIRKRLRARPAEQNAKALPTSVNVRELEASMAEHAQAAKELSSEAAQQDEELRVLTAELAERDPEVAARVVRGWLAEGSS